MRSPERSAAFTEALETPPASQESAISLYLQSAKKSIQAMVAGAALMMPAADVQADAGHSRPGIAEDRCDLIEIHHYHDENTGEYCISHLILREFRFDKPTHKILAYRFIPTVGEGNSGPLKEEMLPRRDFTTNEYVIRWFDKTDKEFRIIRAPQVQETRSHKIPMLAESATWPEQYQPGFTRTRPLKKKSGVKEVEPKIEEVAKQVAE